MSDDIIDSYKCQKRIEELESQLGEEREFAQSEYRRLKGLLEESESQLATLKARSEKAVIVNTVRDITPEEEEFRLEEIAPNMSMVKRNPVELIPVGTIILIPFRIEKYGNDCDGSLLAHLANLNVYGDGTIDDSGWEQSGISIDSNTCLVISQDGLVKLFSSNYTALAGGNDGE